MPLGRTGRGLEGAAGMRWGDPTGGIDSLLHAPGNGLPVDGSNRGFHATRGLRSGCLDGDMDGLPFVGSVCNCELAN